MTESFAFVSYSHKDAQEVLPIVDSLRMNGFSLWVDRLNLRAGSDWGSEVRRALTDASVLLWFAGKYSASSAWMETELTAMMQRDGSTAIVIPVLVDGAVPEQLPDSIRKFQWVDARNDIDSAIDQLAAALEQHLTRSSEEREPQSLNKGYVFVSYSVSDRAFLEDLKTFLRGQSYGYWDFHESKRD